MIKLLTLKRRAKEADKSFLPVDSPAVLLITVCFQVWRQKFCPRHFFYIYIYIFSLILLQGSSSVKPWDQWSTVCKPFISQITEMLLWCWGHDPPLGARIEVDRRAGDKCTRCCPGTALLLVCRPPQIGLGAGEKEINRRAEIDSGFDFLCVILKFQALEMVCGLISCSVMWYFCSEMLRMLLHTLCRVFWDSTEGLEDDNKPSESWRLLILTTTDVNEARFTQN